MATLLDAMSKGEKSLYELLVSSKVSCESCKFKDRGMFGYPMAMCKKNGTFVGVTIMTVCLDWIDGRTEVERRNDDLETAKAEMNYEIEHPQETDL